MTFKTKLRSIYHKLVPTNLRARVSKIRSSKPHQVEKQYYRVTAEDSDKYLPGLVNVSKQFSQKQNLTAQILKPLHEAFATRKVRSYLLEEHWWANFIFAATHLDENSVESQEKLIAHIEQLPLNTFQYWELLHIYSLALRVGLFRVGYALRCKAREIVINSLQQQKKLSNDELIAAIAAQMEIGEYAKARQNILQISDELYRKKQLLSYLYRLIAPENEATLMPTPESDDSEQDKKFRNFVFGKSIAVVGPAKTYEQDATEIDSHNLVVRCNYREKGLGLDSKTKGLKTNIDYLNKEIETFLLNKEVANFPNELDWLVSKHWERSQKIASKINQPSRQTYCKNRAIKQVNSLLFNGTLNAIPNISLDLLRFSPDKIKIFHTDLMLTVERTSSYRPQQFQRDYYQMKETFIRSSCTHDPVTQYFILQKLWEKGNIEGDLRFNEVMSLGEKEYMTQLQLIYGSAGRLVNT